MPSRTARTIWTGRVVFALVAACLVAYLAGAGLDNADKLASVLGAVFAFTALAAPYLFRPPQPASPSPSPAIDGAGRTPERPARDLQAPEPAARDDLAPEPAARDTASTGGLGGAGIDRVEGSGRATAAGGGSANSGLESDEDGRPAEVIRSGDAEARGPGSVANTGIRRGPQHRS